MKVFRRNIRAILYDRNDVTGESIDKMFYLDEVASLTLNR
jgi:hypothetical protein